MRKTIMNIQFVAHTFPHFLIARLLAIVETPVGFHFILQDLLQLVV